MDAQFRADAIGFYEQGPKNLPKHKPSFVKREIELKNFNFKLKNNIISGDEFLSSVGDLFIHKNWFHLIKDAAERIESLNKNVNFDEPNEDQIIEEVAETIFVRNTSSRIKTASRKYFGDEWANQF